MLENVKWLFFDMGSTLIDEHLCYEHQFREIAIAANEKYELIYKKAVDLYKQNKIGNKELAKLYGIKIKWHIEDEILYENVKFCLEEFHKKYKIGIIANQNAGAEGRLKEYGLSEYTDLVIASAEEGIAKPDKRIFEIALKRSGCEPQQAVMIGDRIDNDIVPAKGVGMKTIWIKQGFGGYWNVQNEEEAADMVIYNLTELLSILNK